MAIPSKIPVDYALEKLNESRGNRRAFDRSDFGNLAEGDLVRVRRLRPLFASNRDYQAFRASLDVSAEDWQAVLDRHRGDAAVEAYVRRRARALRSRSPRDRSRDARFPARSVSRTRSAPPRRPRKRRRSRSRIRRRGSRSPSESRSRSRSRSPSERRRARRSESPEERRPNAQRYRKGELAMTSRLGWTPGRVRREAPRSVLSIQKTGDECGPEDVNIPLPICGIINKTCADYDARRRYAKKRPDGTELRDYEIEVVYHEPDGSW